MRLNVWLALSSLACCLAVTHIYDETLWTKQLWSQWKIDGPVNNPTDENPALVKTYPSITGTVRNSLDGPGPRKPKSSGSLAGMDTLDLEPLDDAQLVEPASKAVQCVACHAMMVRVWQHAVAAIFRGDTTSLSEASLRAELAASCKEVSNRVLQQSAVYKMEGEASSQQVILFVVRDRRMPGAGKPKQDPTATEVEAVQLACKRLLEDGSDDFIASMSVALTRFVTQLAKVQAMHLGGDGRHSVSDKGGGRVAAGSAQGSDSGGAGDGSAGSQHTPLAALGLGQFSEQDLARVRGGMEGLELVLRREGVLVKLQSGASGAPDSKGRSSKGDGDEEDEYEEDDDDEEEEEEDDDCMDLHPRCQEWADEGECAANPKYMIGHGSVRGYCRKSCGLCQPASVARKPGTPSPAYIADLQSVINGMATVLKNSACGAGKACLTGVAGTAFQGAVVNRGDVGSVTVPSASGGFELNRPTFGVPLVKDLPPEDKAALEQRHPPHVVTSDEAPSEELLRAAVDAALGPELFGKMLLLPAEFFTFEFVYKNHSRHWRKEGGELTEDWWLGSFQRESVVVTTGSGAAATLEEIDLLPDQKGAMKKLTWPYVKQVYGGGDECVLGGGRRAVRRTEVRIVCSPDDKLRFLLREPDFCSYVYVVYSPALCSVPRYKPQPKE